MFATEYSARRCRFERRPAVSPPHAGTPELIEGPTLADRIAEGPIPLDEALAIAKQIADALDAAHEKNIVHRDLKPANVKIRPDGSVKVLDFGLAKATGPERVITSDSPTMLQTPTQIGVILGTAAYMAPEQARGKQVDKRADIWSFGVVPHEMVTGKRLFEGEDLADTLASVVKSDPDFTPHHPAPERSRSADHRAELDGWVEEMTLVSADHRVPPAAL